MAWLAPASEADSSVATLPANFVTTSSATLHGWIDPGGQPVSWTFEYGAASGPQSVTPFQTIPPGQTVRNYEAATIFQLRPNTTYQFRLAAYFGVGSIYQVPDSGTVLTFTTKATGRLLLTKSRLPVSGTLVSVPLKCQSRIACRGQFRINASKKGTACAAKAYKLHPNKQQTILAPLRQRCLSLLQGQSAHTLRARFYTKPSTGQLGVNRKVTLAG